MLNKKRNKKRFLIGYAIFGFASVMPFSALSAQTDEVETMTVSAQKVEENIQDVPIAISVLDEFALFLLPKGWE